MQNKIFQCSTVHVDGKKIRKENIQSNRVEERKLPGTSFEVALGGGKSGRTFGSERLPVSNARYAEKNMFGC